MGAEAEAVLRQSDGFVTHSTHLPLLVVLLLLFVISCNLANIITPLYAPILISPLVISGRRKFPPGTRVTF